MRCILNCTPKVGHKKTNIGGAFFMSKYSQEEKIRAVQAYLAGEGGFETIAKKYGVSSGILWQWVEQYKLNGELTKPTGNFSGNFKLKVLNYQQENHLSDLQTALAFGITNVGTICAWRKKYITDGTEALFRKRGRGAKMPKKSLIPNKPREEWTKDEELAYLRMENAYLKKLWTLIQKEQQLEAEKQKSQLSEN